MVHKKLRYATDCLLHQVIKHEGYSSSALWGPDARLMAQLLRLALNSRVFLTAHLTSILSPSVLLS